MSDIRTRLRQAHDDVIPPPNVMGSLIHRRELIARRRKDQRRKIGSFIVGLLVVAVGVGVVVHEMARPASNAVPDGDPIPVILNDARLAPGPHAMSLAGLQITFTVPEGWRGSTRGVVDSERGQDPPRGAALSFWTVANVYTDPCHWSNSLARPPVGPSVNELVAALATQHRHPSGDRIKVDVDGYPSTELKMTVPDHIDMATCSNREFHSWTSPEGDRYHQGPGQIDQLFILNVNGVRLVIDASFFPDTSRKVRSTLFEMVRSIHFV